MVRANGIQELNCTVFFSARDQNLVPCFDQSLTDVPIEMNVRGVAYINEDFQPRLLARGRTPHRS